MIRLHYRVADALDDCIERLEDFGFLSPGEDMNDIDNSQQSSSDGGVGATNAAPMRRKRPKKVKASRRASFEVTRNISKVVMNVDSFVSSHNRTHGHPTSNGPVGDNGATITTNAIPRIVSAALNERVLEDCDSSSTQSLSNESK